MLTFGQVGAAMAAVSKNIGSANQSSSAGGASFTDFLDATTSKAKTAATNVTSAENNITDFRNWKTEYLKKGISEDHRIEVNECSSGFEKLLAKASAQSGYDDPQAFVKSLSPDELTVLQHIHCLADPIKPDGLSKEGALNLLYSPDMAKDIDNDGFEMVGLAKTWQFPPVNAPESVKQAWQKTTANMSDDDKMLLSGSFLPLSIEGVTPSDAAYISPDADYIKIVQQVLDGAKFGSKFDESWQHETRDRQISMLTSLLSNLSNPTPA